MEISQKIIVDFGNLNIKYGTSDMDSPLTFQSSIQNNEYELDHFEKIINLSLEKLKMNSEENTLILVEKNENPYPDYYRKTEILFESFNFNSVHIGNHSLSCLYENGKTSGMIIDIGYKYTSISPFNEGYIIPKSSYRFKEIGSKDLQDSLNPLFNPDKDFKGIQYQILWSLEKCQKINQIILSGGVSLNENIIQKLSKELEALNIKIDIIKSNNPIYSSWNGTRMISNFSNFSEMLISRDEYEENGTTYIPAKITDKIYSKNDLYDENDPINIERKLNLFIENGEFNNFKSLIEYNKELINNRNIYGQISYYRKMRGTYYTSYKRNLKSNYMNGIFTDGDKLSTLDLAMIWNQEEIVNYLLNNNVKLDNLRYLSDVPHEIEYNLLFKKVQSFIPLFNRNLFINNLKDIHFDY